MSETGIISGNSPKVYEIAGIDKQKAIERECWILLLFFVKFVVLFCLIYELFN